MSDENKDLVKHLVEEDRIAKDVPQADRTRFISTAVAEQVVAAIRYAARARELVLVTGPAGCGKTTAALAAAAETPGAVFVTVRTAAATPLGLLKAIAAALGLVVIKPNQANLYAAVVEALKGSGRLVVIDEVHRLGCFRNDQGLHILRDIGDECGIGMAWVGVGSIAQYIRAGHAKGLESLDQLYSRIALWLDLQEAAAQGGGGGAAAGAGGGGLVTVEDVRKMIAARKLRLTPEAVRFLVALAREDGAGALRTVDKLLKFAQTYARGAEIDEGMLRGIQARRLGMRAAAVLEDRMAARAARVVA